MNRRREIAKQWHPDAHPNATPAEKERLGKRFAEEMAKLDRDECRAQSDYEPRKWPSPGDAWWDDQEEDDSGRQSEIHRRQRAWEAEQDRVRAEQERSRAEAAAKQAGETREHLRKLQQGVPWFTLVAAPAVAIPAGAALVTLFLLKGSCANSAQMAMYAFLAVISVGHGLEKRAWKKRERAEALRQQQEQEVRERAERARRAQEATGRL